MSKKILIFSILLTFAILISACQSTPPPSAATSTSLATRSPAPALTMTPTVPSTVPTSTAVPTLPTPTLIPTQMAGPLTIVTYQMQASPELEPMLFSSVQGRKFSSEDFSLGDMRIPDLSYFDNNYYCMKKELDGAQLVACQGFSPDGTKGWVKLTKNGSEIYSIDTGSPSPETTLQGLWVYDQHWVLETAYVTTTTSGSETTIDVTGQISVDGEKLNDQKKYDEAFGFQTLDGKPFYYYKQEGKIGFSYDGAETPLDYDVVPHYGCCSMSALNPQAWVNHVNFFGQRGETWFFVAIEVLNQ
jgi:hypothetical protein